MLILQLTMKYVILEGSNVKGYCNLPLKIYLIRAWNWN